jgi:hypothetical protein
MLERDPFVNAQLLPDRLKGESTEPQLRHLMLALSRQKPHFRTRTTSCHNPPVTPNFRYPGMALP